MTYSSEERLLPQQVRAVTFATVRPRGLDPVEVYDYLNRVADELERLRRELTTANTEVERMRRALRRWQSRQAGHHHHDRPTPQQDREPQ
ncbi:DivIVA domain-containing protein [Micromonospora qiuiae]|nr:DivIVA domain-containing protein [Micromonospora qiuiae]